MDPAIPAIKILEPHGFLELQKYCAEDLDVVNAARVSFAKYSEEMGEAENGLIRFLMTAEPRHSSPLEHTFFKFRVRAPISVARDWVRHRIGIAWNEESGRYVRLRPEAYVPEPKFIRTQVGKPGQYKFDRITDTLIIDVGLIELKRSYALAFQTYDYLIDDLGWAKELARNVLPIGLYTEWIWSCNAHSLMHFLTLRNHPDAMEEIQMYARQMESIFGKIMPVTHEWFRYNGG